LFVCGRDDGEVVEDEVVEEEDVGERVGSVLGLTDK
jgi:hypothetical protein